MKLQDIADRILVNTHEVGDILRHSMSNRYLYKVISKTASSMTFQILYYNGDVSPMRNEVFDASGYYSENGKKLHTDHAGYDSIRNFSRHES